MITRRRAVIALGASVLIAPLTIFAQTQNKVWRIGFLSVTGHAYYGQLLDAFNAGMRELGYTEGSNYVIEVRSAQDDLTRLPALAAELLALKVDLILTSGTPAAMVASKAAREIPVVAGATGDPVGSGLAASLRRPAGNFTGLTNLNAELYTKRLDLLRQILPGMRRVGMLYHPDNPASVAGFRNFESGCVKLGFKSIGVPVRKAEEIAAAFNTLQRDKAQGLIVSASNTYFPWRKSIIEMAAKHRLPAVYGGLVFIEDGGLISYVADNADLYRRVATYVDKIFKGAKAGDLPIEQANKYETAINLKTAKALGIKIPDVVMLRADKVIE